MRTKTINQLKAEYILSHWQLRNGVVYSKITDKPAAFSGKDSCGHRRQTIKLNGKHFPIYIHEAMFVLFHRRPVTEGKQLHHIDQNIENNAPDNLIELSPAQHNRIHAYLKDDPLHSIYLYRGAWVFHWKDDDGKQHNRTFYGINEAMEYRNQIEAPRRAELRALGLNCKRAGNRITENMLRRRNHIPNHRLWRTSV
ncbi:HNH endonuclease [Escherichia coli]|nr:HNH endonuclease [Escherichia coli]EFF9100765.1 HNH endonuclease [Escherichia coli]EHK6137196.1 HNH endonuclease [Escherichia coli]EHW6699251.1 HNH endonuclease [Escherichia coli]EIN0392069.1 HNH endonuclease [Escherichia coli]